MKRKSFKEFFDRAAKSEVYWTERAILGFTEELFVLMEKEGVSKAELARRIGSSPAYVTKVFRGDANFTLKSMTKLSHALNRDLRIHLAAPGTVTKWFDVPWQALVGPEAHKIRFSVPVKTKSALAPGAVNAPPPAEAFKLGESRRSYGDKKEVPGVSTPAAA